MSTQTPQAKIKTAKELELFIDQSIANAKAFLSDDEIEKTKIDVLQKKADKSKKDINEIDLYVASELADIDRLMESLASGVASKHMKDDEGEVDEE